MDSCLIQLTFVRIIPVTIKLNILDNYEKKYYGLLKTKLYLLHDVTDQIFSLNRKVDYRAKNNYGKNTELV